MKTGDKVTICDGSYMVTPKNGKLGHNGSFKSTKTIGWCEESFTIICTDLNLPGEDSCGDPIENDTIIQNDKNNEIWFCGINTNIEPLEKEIPELTMKEVIEKIGYEIKITK